MAFNKKNYFNCQEEKKKTKFEFFMGFSYAAQGTE